MTTGKSYAALAREVYDAFNRNDLEAAMAYASDDAEIEVYPLNLSLRGRDGFRTMMTRYKAPYPDGKVEVLNQIAGEDGVTNECVYRATHTAPLPMPDGTELPPTHRPIELRFCEVWRIKDGKVVSLHNYADNLPLLYQLGVLPAPEAAAHH